MPLLNTVNIAGQNLTTVVDLFPEVSALASLTSQAGGQVDTNADFREQIIPVVRNTTKIVPVGEGVAQTVNTPTVTTPKFAVQKWPSWYAHTTEYARTKDPVSLVTETRDSIAPAFPRGFDEWYFDQIVAGASVTEIVFDPTNGVDSLKEVLGNFTTTTYGADGFAMTPLGMNELGWNVDADKHRMDLTQATGIPVEKTSSQLADLGVNRVLGIVGPYGQSKLAISAGFEMQAMPQATNPDGNGPANGYYNFHAEMAMGWGNAQATTSPTVISGAGFVVLTLAP